METALRALLANNGVDERVIEKVDQGRVVVERATRGNWLVVSPALAAVRDSYESLLMKYLLQTRNTNIDSDMSAIQTCTAVLPRLEKIFRLFKEAVSW